MKNILLLASLITGFCLQAQNLRFYEVSNFEQYQSALNLGVKENKMLFFVLYKNGDAFYTMQSDGVFSDPQLVAQFKNTIPVALNVTSDMGSKLIETFGNDALPTFYFINTQEVLIKKVSGQQNTQALIDALANAQQLNSAYPSLLAKFQNHELSNSEWMLFLQIYELNFSFDESLKMAQSFFAELDKTELLSEAILPLLARYGINLETPYPQMLINLNAAQRQTIDYEAFFASAYDFNFDKAIANTDTSLLVKLNEVIIDKAPLSSTEKVELTLETANLFAAETDYFKAWQKAVLNSCTPSQTADKNATVCYDEAYAITDNYNSKAALQAALVLAQKSGGYKSSFNAKMLETYVLYLLKNYPEAQRQSEQARSLASSKDETEKANSLARMILKAQP